VRTARSLLRGSFFRTVDLVLLLGATFWITPLIVHSLGERMYGVWTLIGAFMGYYGLLDFGLSSAAARYLSQSLGKGAPEEVNRVASTTFFLFCAISAAALLLTATCVLACPFFIRDPADLILFRRILVLLGVATALGFPVRVYDGILTAQLRYDSMAYISITRTILANAAIYFALRAGGQIMSVAVISFIVSLLDYAATYGVCTGQYPEIDIRFSRRDPLKMRAMFDHSWKTFLTSISDILRFRIDSVVIAAFLGVSLVTPYAIGVRLIDGFGKVVNSSIGMMQPVFSRYDGRGDYDSIRSALLAATKLSALICAFVGMSILFYGKALIRRWMGPGFDSSYDVAAILCVAFMIELPQSPGIQLLYGLSKHESYAALNAVEALLNVVFSIALLKRYGMYGVVLGTALEVALIKLFVLPRFICASVGIPVKTYLIDTILWNLAKAAVPLGVFFFLIQRLVIPDYLRLVECGLLQTAFFAPVVYFFILSEEERLLLKGLAVSVLEKAPVKKAEGVNAAA
jgi:O-antigen/teichoic acid export membrane protein